VYVRVLKKDFIFCLKLSHYGSVALALTVPRLGFGYRHFGSVSPLSWGLDSIIAFLWSQLSTDSTTPHYGFTCWESQKCEQKNIR